MLGEGPGVRVESLNQPLQVLAPHHTQFNMIESPSPIPNAPENDEETTGLPLLPTWRRVYWFVFIVFVIYTVLLSVLAKVYA